MNKIEVRALDFHDNPGGMMMFLAKLTQRGHNIKNMQNLVSLVHQSSTPKSDTIANVAALPHGTIKRFCPITIAIVGASRRFLAQARTNQVGFNYVSASLQYSNYSNINSFVVPYDIMKHDAEATDDALSLTELYLSSCKRSMDEYGVIAIATDNDTAGYAAPQGLRNILIMQGNHEAWMNFIRLRSCNRNTVETQYVTMLIWEALLKTPDGEEFFKYAGPDCMNGGCREGKMTCKSPMRKYRGMAKEQERLVPRIIIEEKWPLLSKQK